MICISLEFLGWAAVILCVFGIAILAGWDMVRDNKP